MHDMLLSPAAARPTFCRGLFRVRGEGGPPGKAACVACLRGKSAGTPHAGQSCRDKTCPHRHPSFQLTRSGKTCFRGRSSTHVGFHAPSLVLVPQNKRTSTAPWDSGACFHPQTGGSLPVLTGLLTAHVHPECTELLTHIPVSIPNPVLWGIFCEIRQACISQKYIVAA